MKKLIPAYLRVPIFFFIIFGLVEYFIDSGDRPAFIKYPMVNVIMLVVLVLLIAVEIVISAADNIVYQILPEEEKAKLTAQEQLKLTEKAWFKKLINKLTRTVPIEDEASLLLNHDYDGIKELDNNLPPWWVYSFYACILFSAIYLVRFEILGADDQEMELKKELAQAKIEVAEYMKNAPDLMDEKTVTQLTEAPDLAIGKTLFETNCAACHRADAGGQIGPNLTDEHWILGGGIKNIFHTISNGGRDGKGMISWKGTLKPKEIQKIASYIMSLKGSNPKDPKAPDGEIWVDENPAVAEAK
ncbi:cbb3-type cytochrome c oxidase N-terminal domain-containing protein [Flavobacterium seoulense]|uniref:Cytochrome C oxidase subunit III n=1 Tax=Flavobacterium seoulense TaxID=1492738 RepID=A0A066WUI4_9FLAO|nr:cbb3-type cytochrome c oxidase N-terminal domain-containing protein [Flavobacterium seoulense]KDN54629.1 cytochrome C oxidase subunit III [Flavobacterium seoulense]